MSTTRNKNTGRVGELRAKDEETCLCGTCVTPHALGKHPDCEYFDHHCDSCHEKKLCTKTECKEAPMTAERK